MKTLCGIGASPGVAAGPLYHFNNTARRLTYTAALDLGMERMRFDMARQQAIITLGELYQKVRIEIGAEKSMIFEIHQMLLEDPDYTQCVNQVLYDLNCVAEYAVQQAGEQLAMVFSVMEDAYMRERSADIRDISNRIVRLLCGEIATDLSHKEGQLVLAADDLLPSETIQIDQSKVLAFITRSGSRVSHSAILARTMGIPVVVGLGAALDTLANGELVLVDGFTGIVTVRPDGDTT